MIKAETISHETLPAPNWLDHCRTLVTPARSLALLLIIGIAVLAGLVEHHRSETVGNLPASSQSQQSSKQSVNGLTVEPLQQLTPANGSGSAVQPAGGAPKAEVKAASTDGSSNNLGAGSTPALNNTTTSSSSSQPVASPKSQLNGSLTKTIQSVVPQLPVVNKVVKHGLLGL